MKSLVVVFSVLLAVFLAGCTNLPVTNLKECGTDFTGCFSESARKCEPATVKYDISSSGSSGLVFLFEVRSGTPESCKFYARVDDYKFPTGYTPTTTDLQRASDFKGKDMECVVPPTVFISGGADLFNRCTGSLADAFKESY